MSQRKKYARGYSHDYLKMGFIEAPHNKQLPMCLLCLKVFANESMKPCRLKGHLSSVHPEHKDKPLDYFQLLLRKFINLPATTTDYSLERQCSDNRDGLIATYQISYIIAKTGNNYNIGEVFLRPCIEKLLNTVLHIDSTNILKKLPLSESTVRRRMIEMSLDVETQMINILRRSSFSIQLDESASSDNNSLLMVYVQYLNDSNELQEGMLFSACLNSDKKGLSMFDALKTYFEKNSIPLTNIIACAVDGAPSKIGRYRGFTEYLKKEVPNVLCTHCIVHRQHLVDKTLSPILNSSLNTVIKAVNKIKTNSRLLQQMCQDSDEKFKKLLIHTEVHWLSQSSFLARFIALNYTIFNFLNKNHEFDLTQKLRFARNDTHYLADIFKIFEDNNLHLRGDMKTLISCKNTLLLFIEKLNLLRLNIENRQFHEFPNLLAIMNDITSEEIEKYSSHIKELEINVKIRFHDILNLEIHKWMVDPFTVSLDETDVIYQEEVVEMKYDFESRFHFFNNSSDSSDMRIQKFWLNKRIPELYPKMWGLMEKMLISFPMTDLVESGFRLVNKMMTQKKRNCQNIAERADIRLNLTKLEPDLNYLVSLRQAQGSH